MARAGAEPGLIENEEELALFKAKYSTKPFVPVSFEESEVVDAFIGLDVGSTSTKAVLMNEDKVVLAKAYQLSKGNPIEDTKDVLRKLHEQVLEAGANHTRVTARMEAARTQPRTHNARTR